MDIPQNITSEHIVRAIQKIDIEGIPPGGDSQYYDVYYEGKRYPPKVLVSFANFFANGEILDRNKFEGGLGTQCFKILEERGFKIVNKMSNVTQKIKQFSNSYKEEVENRHSKELTSHRILVNELPTEIIPLISKLGNNLTIKGSIGAGVNTYYPWLGIFDSRVSSGAQNGFYVVLLFSDDFEDLYLTLNQGSTIQTKEQTEAYRNFVYRNYELIDGFRKGKIPQGGLVKTKTGSASEKGKKYEETNIYYRHYKIDALEEEEFIFNLSRLVRIYVDCADKYSTSAPSTPHSPTINNESMNLNYKEFYKHIRQINLMLNERLILRFISSLLTKPFVILTGLSGSGKTKLAWEFAKWICEDPKQYCLIPIGADWTNREPLLGFPNALEPGKYVKPDNPVLDLIISANTNENKPHFLILDEMNLSHVERYFADFLSVMESGDYISLHSEAADWKDDVPAQMYLPKNLFIIGTVNIDETTYMFSPKVLDRASVIEFRVTAEEMNEYIGATNILAPKPTKSEGAFMADGFLDIAKNVTLESKYPDELRRALMLFFVELRKTGAEFGYRSASEILRFSAIVNKIEPVWEATEIIDAAIMQKLLPKVHGSRKKLEKVLLTLARLCIRDETKNNKEFKIESFLDSEDLDSVLATAIYPVSFEKISRMYKGLLANGFTSYAEA